MFATYCFHVQQASFDLYLSALCPCWCVPAASFLHTCTVQTALRCSVLQADPHPGNLIRTPDGRLCILDFGLMCRIDNNIKFGMIEAVSHLIHRWPLPLIPRHIS